MLPLAFSFLVIGAVAWAQAPAAVLAGRGLAALGASPAAGYLARGTATLTTTRGDSRGIITIAAWGADHCKVTVDIADGRRFELIANGPGLTWRGPAAWAELTPLGGRFTGCALLPQGLLWADLAAGTASAAAGADPTTLVVHPGRLAARGQTLTLDPSSGLPALASWSGRSGAVTVRYAGYTTADGLTYPGSVTVTDGSRTLVVALTNFTAHPGFADADFPASPPKPVSRTGGQR